MNSIDSLSPNSREFYEKARLNVFYSLVSGALGLMVLGFTSIYGGISYGNNKAYQEELKETITDQYLKEANESRAAGYGFATMVCLVSFLVFIVGSLFASPFIFGIKKQSNVLSDPQEIVSTYDDISEDKRKSKLVESFVISAIGLWFLGLTAVYGAESYGNRKVEKYFQKNGAFSITDTTYHKDLSSGYGVGSASEIIAFILFIFIALYVSPICYKSVNDSLSGASLELYENSKYKLTLSVFLSGFGLLMLAFTAISASHAAGGRKVYEYQRNQGANDDIFLAAISSSDIGYGVGATCLIVGFILFFYASCIVSPLCYTAVTLSEVSTVFYERSKMKYIYSLILASFGLLLLSFCAIAGGQAKYFDESYQYERLYLRAVTALGEANNTYIIDGINTEESVYYAESRGWGFASAAFAIAFAILTIGSVMLSPFMCGSSREAKIIYEPRELTSILTHSNSDSLTDKAREFYERSKMKFILSLASASFGLLLTGIASVAIVRSFSNKKEYDFTADQEKVLSNPNDDLAIQYDALKAYYVAQISGYGFGATCLIIGAVLFYIGAFYISPFTCGTYKETSIIVSPRDGDSIQSVRGSTSSNEDTYSLMQIQPDKV